MWRNTDYRIKAVYGLAHKISDKDKKIILNRAIFLKQDLDEEEISHDTWVNCLIASTKLKDTRAFRLIKRIGLALASTSSTELFLCQQFNGTTTLSPWAAPSRMHGRAPTHGQWLCLKHELGLDISSGINPSPTWWKSSTLR